MVKRVSGFIRQFERNLWVLAFGWFVAAMGFAASIPFIAIYFHEQLDMSPTEIGLFFAAMAVIRSVFQPVGGELSDHVGRRPLLIFSQLVRTVAFFFMALAIAGNWGFWAIAFCMLTNSIVGAVYMPTINAMVADILPAEKRLDGFAVTRAAGNLGWAVGPAIGGFLAESSYASLFFISSAISFLSSLIFWRMLKVPNLKGHIEAFRLKDLMAVRHDTNLAIHVCLILFLYLVVAQLVMPFSLYTVDMVGISENMLGRLFTLNGLIVVLMQVPVTRLLHRLSFTHQLAMGAFLYFVGYSSLGWLIGYGWFALAITIVTTGEIIMSPPSLTLTSRLAPEGHSGRYMGVYGFFVTAGWSLGPLWGGTILDHLGGHPGAAWLLIASMAVISSVGYLWFGRRLPARFNGKDTALGEASI